jgi:hypothetical protein
MDSVCLQQASDADARCSPKILQEKKICVELAMRF